MNSIRNKREGHVGGVYKIDNDQKTPEQNDELLETFLLGNISDLLYEIKRFAISSSSARSASVKRRNIAKLKHVLKSCRNLLGRHFKQIISEFIQDTFEHQKVSRQDLRKIQSWWLKNVLKINN